MKITQKLAIKYIQTKLKLTALFSKRRAAQQAFTLFCTPLPAARQQQILKKAGPLQFILNNKKVHGYRWNYPQPKKILILHGFNSAAYKFERYVKPLVEKGYEVLAFDAPAHGSSGGKTTNAVEYSQMIKKVMASYGPINSFIAHSFGGIALSLAMETAPHDEQTKIVFIAPATETTSAIDSAFALLGIRDKKVRQEFDQLVYNISGNWPAWFSIRRAVKNIKAKILWVHDEDDDITPLSDALKVKADNNPHIEFLITKGLGHRKIYHDAEVKKAVIDFL